MYINSFIVLKSIFAIVGDFVSKIFAGKKKHKLKIAICFFGHLRSFKRCAPALKRCFLDKYDCDLFIHTWDMLNHNTKTI